MFYKLKFCMYLLPVKSEIVRNGISNRMLNGKMPNIAGRKDNTPEILLSLLWDCTCSQKLGVYMEHESRAWNPALHNYFFSMETILALFFYKTIGVIVLLISLLEHPNCQGTDFMQQRSKPFGQAYLQNEMQDHTVRKTLGKENLPVSQWLRHSGGHDSGGLTFVCRIACLDTWKKYPCSPDTGSQSPGWGFILYAL